MLIRFNIGNFLSFNETQEFSMIPGKVQKFKDHLIESDEINLLKYCAMYGANASGKSNFVKAFDIARQIIVRGIKRSQTTNKHCRYFKDNKDNPTSFEFEIRLNDKCYAYGYKVYLSSKKIHSEWLYEINSKEEILLFERVVSNSNFNNKIPNLLDNDKTKLDVYIDDIKNMDDNLFLTEMARKKFDKNSVLKLFNNLFNWFNDRVKIIYPTSKLGGAKYFFSNNERDKIIELLTIFDTGIVQFHLVEVPIDELKSNIPKVIIDDIIEKVSSNSSLVSIFVNGQDNLFEISQNADKNIVVKKLFFKHGSSNKNTDFEYHEESDGTKRLIDLLMIIQESIRKDDAVFVVDEIDRSLHPKLSKKFIELFFEVTKDSRAQLITTTHESSLMDLSLLRRDEIWFVEREENYQSRLFSLDEFKERYDKKVEKAYLEGRYGALPIFKDWNSTDV